LFLHRCDTLNIVHFLSLLPWSPLSVLLLSKSSVYISMYVQYYWYLYWVCIPHMRGNVTFHFLNLANFIHLRWYSPFHPFTRMGRRCVSVVLEVGGLGLQVAVRDSTSTIPGLFSGSRTLPALSGLKSAILFVEFYLLMYACSSEREKPLPSNACLSRDVWCFKKLSLKVGHCRFGLPIYWGLLIWQNS
jgi:hypothetical protein